MASSADLEAIRRALNGLSAKARGDFMKVWSQLDQTDAAATRRVLMAFWPDLLTTYGGMASALAADVFEVQAEALGVKPKTRLVRAVDAERASARLGWALSTTETLGNAVVLLDELVKQPYRATFAASAGASGAGWARVPSGAETCPWCLILASRGAVYRSKDTAAGRKYHGDCDCTPTLVRDESDYPDGYDPDALYQRYLEASAKSTGPGLAAVAKAMA